MKHIYIVLAGLFGIAGIELCVRWSDMGTFSIGYLFNFLPMTAFLLAFVASWKIPRTATHMVAIPLCLVVLAAWGVITLFMEIVITATTEVTDERKYDDVLEDYWQSEEALVSHFPRPIPPNAKEVEFSFHPAFLQGGAHIQLRYSLPSEVISELYGHFSEKKTMLFVGGNMNDHINMKEGMPTTFFYTSGFDTDDFPDDYEIMIFDQVLREEDRPEGHYWNHGQSHGVAISRKRNEIVYWAESW